MHKLSFIVLLLCSISFGQSRYPAGDVVERLYRGESGRGVEPTHLGRGDYLKLIAGNVDFFKKQQNEAGAIIDPYVHAEKQYSTPAFALAAAVLVVEERRGDLLKPAEGALTFSIHALANRTTADFHADFYIPMVMHARRLLEPKVEKETAEHWRKELLSLVPEKTYRDTTAGGNWNLVNVAGEMLRRKDGVVAEDQREGQLGYLERCVEKQLGRFTEWGMYVDPNAPMAYDIFPRLWLEDVVADGAWVGKEKVDGILERGGLTTLLLLSPTGEWPCGGRSAQHQWNEAAVAVVCEIEAKRWKARGRMDVAGSFKRGAHLALASLQRWQRPSGELWIVKNRADPSKRFGFEGYSFHSQYNLLPVAMLAMAYERADESIGEGAIPAESAGYVVDLREKFHKVVAACGGYYVEIDTAADPHYNATGLQRVQRAGVAYSPLSDSSAAQRAFGPAGIKAKMGIAPGLLGVAGSKAKEVVYHEGPPRGTKVEFGVVYPEGREDYVVSGEGVEVTLRPDAGVPAERREFVFPLLLSDGEKEIGHEIEEGRIAVGAMRVMLEPKLKLTLHPERYATHNGEVGLVTALIPAGVREIRYRITLGDRP